MSSKISDFFKTERKNTLNCDLNQESFVKVKIEKEEIFEINLNAIESKLKKSSSYPLEDSKCRVNSQKIKNDTQNKRLKKSTIIKSEMKAVKENYQKTLKPGQVKCKFCIKIMVKGSVRRHIQSFHPEHAKRSNLICEICSQEFQGLITLRGHMTKRHPKYASKPKYFECDFDGKIFKTRTNILTHMAYHQSKLKCELCEVEVIPFVMQKHIDSFHTKERKYQCQICQKSFMRVETLLNHVKTHNKRFECQICSKLFPSQGTLNNHIKQTHENPGSFECQICSKKFNRKETLKNHQKVHDRNRPKPYKCQRCCYATDKNWDMKLHEKAHENQDKKLAKIKNPLKCEKCSAFFKNKYLSTQHMKQVHPDQLFHCDLCGKYIKSKYYLTKHIEKRICKKFKM